MLFLYFSCDDHTSLPLLHRKYLDRGADRPEVGGESFQLYWSQFTRTLKRCIFFVLTIAYLPIARAVLENFAGEYDAKVLKLYGYVVLCGVAEVSLKDARETLFLGVPTWTTLAFHVVCKPCRLRLA